MLSLTYSVANKSIDVVCQFCQQWRT